MKKPIEALGAHTMEITATTLRNRLLNRVRLRHLHLFVKVADLHTVKRAAEAVGISQPTATQTLADLEHLLEVPLFLRHAHGMRLTAAGDLLLPLARRSLQLIDETATYAAAMAQGSRTVVRVAAISAAMGGALGRAIPDFARAYPDVLVQLQEADAARQAALVANGDVDCAICRAPAVLPEGWSFTPVWDDRFVVVAGPAHPLARKRSTSMAELLEATWLVTPASVAAREAFDALTAQASGKVNTCNVVTASATMVWRLLSQQPLVALVPRSMVERLIEVGQLVELPWPLQLPLGPIGILAPVGEAGQALNLFIGFITGPGTPPT
ncbi:LysR family transcriptional regulator [Polaromonas sp.]|uniref:LysR family transcriptional regulator n=1 Tax=Polaromonas sp. TaxID=1869339 RepID=UPI003264EB1F